MLIYQSYTTDQRSRSWISLESKLLNICTLIIETLDYWRFKIQSASLLFLVALSLFLSPPTSVSAF